MGNAGVEIPWLTFFIVDLMEYFFSRWSLARKAKGVEVGEEMEEEEERGATLFMGGRGGSGDGAST